MDAKELPAWLTSLDETDLQFIKRMVLASGSLKQLAADYGVSYPTIRQRLDGVIERIRLLDKHAGDDALQVEVRLLVAAGSLTPQAGRDLLRLHRQTRRKET